MTEAGQGCLKGVKLGFIGAGNMGAAIIRGLLAGGRVGAIWAAEPELAGRQLPDRSKDAPAAPVAIGRCPSYKPQLLRSKLDEALDLVASKFKQIIVESGPDAISGVSCSRSINEDSYYIQRLFREAIGTNNIDNCARV